MSLITLINLIKEYKNKEFFEVFKKTRNLNSHNKKQILYNAIYNDNIVIFKFLKDQKIDFLDYESDAYKELLETKTCNLFPIKLTNKSLGNIHINKLLKYQNDENLISLLLEYPGLLKNNLKEVYYYSLHYNKNKVTKLCEQLKFNLNDVYFLYLKHLEFQKIDLESVRKIILIEYTKDSSFLNYFKNNINEKLFFKCFESKEDVNNFFEKEFIKINACILESKLQQKEKVKSKVKI